MQEMINKNLVITPDDYERLAKGDVITKTYGGVVYRYNIMFDSDVLEMLDGKGNE